MVELESWWASLTGRGTAGAHSELRILRLLTVAFAVALVVISAVPVARSDGWAYPMPWPALWGLAAALSLAGFGILRRVQRVRLVVAADAQTIRAGYRTRMLLGCAFGEAPALIGFVLSIHLDSPAPYLVALPVALAAIWVAAPTATDIRSIQADRDVAGHSLRLPAVLMEASA